MPRKVLIIDTSVLACWLRVPEKSTCGPAHDQWDYTRINNLINAETGEGGTGTLVLPVATLIETGNHIAQSKGDKFALAGELTELLRKTIKEEEPWAAFEHQSELWNNDNLENLVRDWPGLAAQGLGIGDATIKDVAEFYASTGTVNVEILTGDEGLRAYQPAVQVVLPRRRRASR